MPPPPHPPETGPHWLGSGGAEKSTDSTSGFAAGASGVGDQLLASPLVSDWPLKNSPPGQPLATGALLQIQEATVTQICMRS